MKKEVSMERSAAGTKEKKKSRQPKLSLSKYINDKHNLLVFYQRWKKYNEIQLTKNKMDLNDRKIKNHPFSPENWVKHKPDSPIESRKW